MPEPLEAQKPNDDPFAGINGTVSTGDIVVGDRFKIAIVGKPKSGKSWMASTAPGPILYYDFDDRSESIAGKANIRVKTLIDRDPLKPTAIAELESDLNTLKYAKSQGKPIPKTFVLDSMTWMIQAISNELFKQEPTLYRDVKVTGTRRMRISQGYDYWNGLKQYVNYIVGEFASLGNLVTVWHSRDEKDKAESTKTETKYTGRLTVEPQSLESVLSTINHVFFVEVDEMGRYIVTTQPTMEIPASTTMRLPKETVPDINAMLELHRKAVNASQTKK